MRLDAELKPNNQKAVNFARLTIEHLMPQKITNSYWQSRFDLEQHARWLYKLDNLILITTSKNGEIQISDFEKNFYLKGKGMFDLTEEVCQIEDWNIHSITKRHNQLK